MSATPTVSPAGDALEAILSRQSAVTLKEPGPSAEHLETMLRAGTRAPDHGKLQPWRFVIVEGDARARLGDAMAERLKLRDAEATESDLERERAKAFRAPTIVVAVAKIIDAKIPAIEQQYAVAAACQNVVLAAHALGYGAMWKSGASAYDDGIKGFLGFEPRDEIVGFLYLGTTDIAQRKVRETKYDEVVSRI